MIKNISSTTTNISYLYTANSYSSGTLIQEAITIEVDPDDPESFSLPEDLPAMPSAPAAPGPSSVADTAGVTSSTPSSIQEKRPTTSRKRRRIRRSLYDEDIYVGHERVNNATKEDAQMRQNIIKHRETLLELQKKQAQFRVEEAELQRHLAFEELEEARKKRKINEEILENKLVESRINRQIAEAKAAQMGSPVWL